MTPRGVGAPAARPGAPRFGSTQAFESPKPPSTPVPAQPQFVGAPRRAGKSHLSSTVAFEVSPDEVQKSIEDAASRAQSTQSKPFAEEKPPDTKSFGRMGGEARARGTVGPVRTGKSHLSRTVAFFAEDDQAAAKKVQQKVDEAAARVGRIPGPAAPPPLPAGEVPPSAPPGVIGAAVIDVATTPSAPEPEHWHHPAAAAHSKEAALKMKLLTSRKKTMIGGVNLLDMLDAEREAQQASGEFAPPQEAPPVDPGIAPPPAAPPPAGPPPGGPLPPGERSQPFLAPHPLGVQRRGTMMGIGSQEQGPPGGLPAGGPPPIGPPMGAPPMGPPRFGPPPMGPPPGMAPVVPPPSAPFAPPMPAGPPPLLEPSPGPFPVPQPPQQPEPAYGAAPGFGELAPPFAPAPAAFTPPPSSLTIPKKKTSVFVYVVLTIVVMVVTAGATLFYLYFR